VFRTALEPDAWRDVMRLMKLRFPSEAQTFHFLHLKRRQVRPVCLLGSTPDGGTASTRTSSRPTTPGSA
jgi:hypothetical protein